MSVMPSDHGFVYNMCAMLVNTHNIQMSSQLTAKLINKLRTHPLVHKSTNADFLFIHMLVFMHVQVTVKANIIYDLFGVLDVISF